MNLEALKNTLFENIDYTDNIFTKHFHNTYTIGIIQIFIHLLNL